MSFCDSFGKIAFCKSVALVTLVGLACNTSFAADKASDAPAAWKAMPIEIPKTPSDLKWTSDEEMYATEGPVWAGEGSAVALVRFDLNGKFALVALSDGVCHVLDPKAGESRRHWDTGNTAKLVAMEITLDGKCVVMQYEDRKKLFVRRLEDGKLLQTLAHADAPITTFAVAADPRLLAAGDTTSLIQLWDIETGKVMDKEKVHHPGGVPTAMVFSNDCQNLYVADNRSNKIAVHELPDLLYAHEIDQPCGVPLKMTATWSGNSLLVICEDRAAKMIRLRPTPGSNERMYQVVGSAALAKGEGDLENYSYLQNVTIVGCYLGGTSFKYYGLDYGGLAGSKQDRRLENARVALTPDGSTAATGLSDGSVRFYRLPGPGTTETIRNRQYGARLRMLLKEENYSELDEQALQGMRQSQGMTTRWSRADLVQSWLTYTDQNTDEGWKSHLARLQKWVEAKPESRAALWVLADAYKDYGWFLRGSDVVARTSPEAMLGHQEQLSKADKLLKEADALGPPSAPICTTWIWVSMGLGKSKSTIIGLWEKGLKDSAEYPPLHEGAARALLPRWMGEPGDVAKLADRALKEIPDEMGLVAYALMAGDYMTYEPVSTLLPSGFDIEILEKSAQAVVRKYSENLPAKNFAAIVACMRQDHKTAEDRMLALAGDFEQRKWNNPWQFNKFRLWSRGKPVQVDAERSFLASWIGLRQLMFENDGAHVLTLGLDGFQQIQSWDIASGQPQLIMPMPPEIITWLMSKQGRYFVFATMGTERSIVVMDRETHKSFTWPGVVKSKFACISDDEKQFASVDQDNRVVVYDLTENSNEPLHTITLDQEFRCLDIRNDSKTWSLIVGEAGGRLRVLSEEGKDLIPPVQLSQPALHLQIFPDAPRVLVGGDKLLAVVDIETGKVVNLADGTSQDADLRYTALAINREGTIAAASRQHLNQPQSDQPFAIEIWDLAAARRVHVLPGHEAEVFTMSVSDDNLRLASGDRLGFVNVWNLSALELPKKPADSPAADAEAK
jgi:WD40 repeat protein